jgi:Fur family ferric uptake transcriptional regulator
MGLPHRDTQPYARLATFIPMRPPSKPTRLTSSKPLAKKAVTSKSTVVQAASSATRKKAGAAAAAPADAARLGQRNTRPRAAIVGILESARGPLTVAEIHAHAQKAEPSATIGIATVYRTLNLLVENKLAQTVMLPTGETRYEAAGHKGHHDHFQCVQCESVFDIDTCQLKLPTNVLIAGGFRVQGHELTLTGLCPDCDEPGKRPRRPASHSGHTH